ncbi:hypothetical protein WG66_010015 [Moniliophthora roreri]|nr:hypothetical protein WG66_010015 [Moniliophthora roreri]
MSNRSPIWLSSAFHPSVTINERQSSSAKPSHYNFWRRIRKHMRGVCTSGFCGHNEGHPWLPAVLASGAQTLYFIISLVAFRLLDKYETRQNDFLYPVIGPSLVVHYRCHSSCTSAPFGSITFLKAIEDWGHVPRDVYDATMQPGFLYVQGMKVCGVGNGVSRMTMPWGRRFLCTFYDFRDSTNIL